jgi:hypothetical protein
LLFGDGIIERSRAESINVAAIIYETAGGLNDEAIIRATAESRICRDNFGKTDCAGPAAPNCTGDP